jgi:hypothetical protein
MVAAPHLQTKRQKVAHGMTSDEFEDCMWDLRQFMDQLSDEVELKRHEHWLLSIDSDAAHTGADLDGRGIWPKDHRLYLPPLSPDMHKVVEHVHGNLTRQHTHWRRSLFPNKPTPQQCIDKMEELFYKYPVDAIQKDVDSLLKTYDAIEHAAGMYPPKAAR